MAAPVGGQILSEVLPYLELQKDNSSEEEDTQIETPDLRGKTLKEAKEIIKELGLELELNEKEENNINEGVISNQIPFPGIKINKNSKIYVDI